MPQENDRKMTAEFIWIRTWAPADSTQYKVIRLVDYLINLIIQIMTQYY
jgi:hypothetical protein